MSTAKPTAGEPLDQPSAASQVEFRFAESPWFWLALFGSVAIVGLTIVGQKYAKRQMRLEVRYQNRVQMQKDRQARAAGEQIDRRGLPMSAIDARPRAALAPLVALFALLAATGYAGLFLSYRRHHRTLHTLGDDQHPPWTSESLHGLDR